MQHTIFEIPGMDCSAEEQLVRMKLDQLTEVKSLVFDLTNRRLTVFHEGEAHGINEAIGSLGLGSRLVSSSPTDEDPGASMQVERRILWVVLGINLLFFIVESVAGFISNSMGLVADSLDMLIDALVYGMSLYAVGKMMSTKKKIAKFSGYLEMGLAVLGLMEVLRRFIGFEKMPHFETMILVSLFALAGNAACIVLLKKTKSEDAHIRASLIFTNNDVIVNLGVILAGIAVYFSGSKYPDLVIGSIIFVVVAKGAVRILRLSK